MIEAKLCGKGHYGKTVASQLRYWKTTPFATWALAAVHDWDLIEWRRDLLDEDAAEAGEACGPAAECAAQTAIHRLNALSKLFQLWSRAHRVPLISPVKPGVRPGRPPWPRPPPRRGRGRPAAESGH